MAPMWKTLCHSMMPLRCICELMSRPALVQVVGVRLAPFEVEKENLLLAAMFHPLNQKLWIHQALVTNVGISCKWDHCHRDQNAPIAQVLVGPPVSMFHHR
jgi:hypothetical protein